jgi:hypothetical protein
MTRQTISNRRSSTQLVSDQLRSTQLLKLQNPTSKNLEKTEACTAFCRLLQAITAYFSTPLPSQPFGISAFAPFARHLPSSHQKSKMDKSLVNGNVRAKIPAITGQTSQKALDFAGTILNCQFNKRYQICHNDP